MQGYSKRNRRFQRFIEPNVLVMQLKYMVFWYVWTASVVYWSEFLAANPEVPGSILGVTRFCG
jgi:hypothetical protein